MNLLAIAMLISAGLCGMIASHKERRPAFWLGFGLVAGPIAVAIILWLPSSAVRVASASPPRLRSLVDEINGLEEMRQRGIINDDEFRQGKVQVLAWPVASPIPPALTPQRVWMDGRRTWTSYQPAARSAFSDLARRHGLDVRWRDDVPLEIVATYAVQPGLSLEFSLGLEKGTIHCWGEGWDLDAADLYRPGTGLPADLDQALDALIEGTGRIAIRTAINASSPFCVSLQVPHDGRWRTVRRRWSFPVPPLWRKTFITNMDARQRTTAPSQSKLV